MNCNKGNFSLVDNCWNELTESWERFPCQPTICQTPGSIPGDGKSLPDLAVALIICSVIAIIGLLTALFLKNRCERGLTFIIGGVLAANLTPPLPRTANAEASRAEKPSVVGQGRGGQDLMPTAPPPNYDEIMVV